MFPLPYPTPYNWLLYILFALDLALLFSGLLLAKPSPGSPGRLPLPLRMSLSTIVLAAAILQWRLAATSYAGWVCLGMALGFLGDLVMSGLLRLPDRLIFGMLAFGAGLGAYLLALVGAARGLGLWRPPLHLSLGALMLLAGILLWRWSVFKPGGDRLLNGAALAYGLLMASLNAAALALAVQEARFIPLAVGALLFLGSDLILANWNIRGHTWPGVNDAIWLTYNLAQLLIVYSVAAQVRIG